MAPLHAPERRTKHLIVPEPKRVEHENELEPFDGGAQARAHPQGSLSAEFYPWASHSQLNRRGGKQSAMRGGGAVRRISVFCKASRRRR